ncbi:MAG: MFS transporter, partial [Candidatus Omnitrophica bacterium]|nr:MFS transporter [Candidatus Omnitrophota bacterium]
MIGQIYKQGEDLLSKFSYMLKEKNFFCFWLGQIISQFGDRLNQMALIALIYNRTGGSAFGLAKIMSFTIIPSFLVSPFAGAYVDRWNYKYTMIISDIIRGVLVLLIPLWVVKMDTLVPLYISVFLVFTTSCFFLPSKFSIIPELVDKEKLLIANSLTNTTMLLAAVFGIGLGGTLIEKVGAKSGFYIDSFTYFVSGLLLCFVNVKNKNKIKNDAADDTTIKNGSIFSDIKEGIKYVAANPYLRFVFSTIFMLMSAAGALYIAAIVFIQQVFSSVTRDLGVLSIFMGGGFFLGALICGRFFNKISKVRVIFLSMIASGIFIGCFAVLLKMFQQLYIAMILSVLIGIGVGPIFISGNTLIHEVIKSNMRGRIFSILGII